MLVAAVKLVMWFLKFPEYGKRFFGEVIYGNIGYRFKRARPRVISWLAAQGFAYEDLPSYYIKDFHISEGDYQKALLKLPLSNSEASES